MCGIIGYSGNAPLNPDKIKILFMYNESRGKQASGFYVNNLEKSFEERVIKSLGPASENLLPSYSIDSNTLLIGHVRQASVGGVGNINNVHPFIEGNLVGVHNGTFSNHEKVRKAFEIDKFDSEVDSQLFYKLLSINKNDFYETYCYFEGGAALVWSTKDNPDVLNVFRNKDRPLYRGTYKEGESVGIYISSLEEPLKVIGCTNVQEFKEDKLYTITKGVVTVSNKFVYSKELPEVVEEETTKISKEITVLFEGDRRFKNTENTDTPGSHYKLTSFEDGSITVDSEYNARWKEDKAREIIYCKERKRYFYRVYFGIVGKEREKFIDYHIPTKLFQSNSFDSIPDITLPEIEGVTNLLYTFWGLLMQFQLQAEEAEIQNKKIDFTQLQVVMDKMEKYLNIAVD